MLMLGVPAVTMAQGTASGPFADVPADHWAYQSVDTLQKAGIVIGYPDGTYGGKRSMTRYEFSVAIARLLPLLNGKSGDYATKDDLAAARADLEKHLAANSDAIDALRKLVDEFGPELQRLGQDVAAVKTRLDALEARVAAVEMEQRRVKFNGALNIIAKAETITKGAAFMDRNGEIVQTIPGPPANPIANSVTVNKHLLQASDVYHDFVLGITGRVSDTSTANVKIDFGNYLSAVGNTVGGMAYPAANLGAGQPVGTLNGGNQQTTVWEANLAMPTNLGPLGSANMVVGRFGAQWTKYTLMQADADVYTSLMQTDDGNIPVDGMQVGLKLGPAKVSAWGGQTKAIPFAQPYAGSASAGSPLGGNNVGKLPGGLLVNNHAVALTQGAGVRATFGDPKHSVLGVTVEQFGYASPINDVERPTFTSSVESVYGADFNGALPFFGGTGLIADLNWTTSAQASSSQSFNDTGNNWRYQATDDQLGIAMGSLTLKGGYQYIGPNFSAPGYWGKVGAWTNPTNVEGGVASAKFAFSPKLSLNANYAGYKAAYGSTSAGGPVQSPLQQGEKLDNYRVGLAYGLTSAYNVDLGYEQSIFTLKATPFHGSGKPTQSFISFGIGHPLSANSSFKLLYQVAQYRDKNTTFGGVVGDSDGDVAVGQFEAKF